jgi:hypothetical protein
MTETIRMQFKVRKSKISKDGGNEIIVKLDDVKDGTHNNTTKGSVKFARFQREDDNKALKGNDDTGSAVGTAGNFR